MSKRVSASADNSWTPMALMVIFIIALVLRLGVSYAAPVFYGGDDVSYDDYARTMLEKHELYIDGRVSSFRPPLYIIFLAVLFKIFGHNLMAVKIVQSLLGAATCIAIYGLAKEIVSEKAGLLSATIAAFYIPFVYMPAHILTETLYTFLLTLSILFFAKSEIHQSLKWQVLTGLSLGLASLTKGTPQLVPLFMLMLMVLRSVVKRVPIRKILFQFTFICIFFLIPIIPWTIRNCVVHKGFVMITTETGEAFYSAYHPPEGKRFGFSTVDDTKRKWKEINFRSEIEGSRYLMDENMKFIMANPMKVAKMTVLKIAFMWSPFDWEILGGNGVYNFSYGFIIPFIIIGVFASIVNRIFYSLILYMPIAYSQGLGVAFDASPRYRFPIEPFLIVIASIGILYIYRKFARQKALVSAAIAGFLTLNIAMFAYSYEVKAAVRGIFEALKLW